MQNYGKIIITRPGDSFKERSVTNVSFVKLDNAIKLQDLGFEVLGTKQYDNVVFQISDLGVDLSTALSLAVGAKIDNTQIKVNSNAGRFNLNTAQLEKLAEIYSNSTSSEHYVNNLITKNFFKSNQSDSLHVAKMMYDVLDSISGGLTELKKYGVENNAQGGNALIQVLNTPYIDLIAPMLNNWSVSESDVSLQSKGFVEATKPGDAFVGKVYSLNETNPIVEMNLVSVYDPGKVKTTLGFSLNEINEKKESLEKYL